MTAKEMFEELGYKNVSDNPNIITYCNGFDRIVFFNKKIRFSNPFEIWRDIAMIKAINKQVEELGWK